jgi:hypothetical protein
LGAYVCPRTSSRTEPGKIAVVRVLVLFVLAVSLAFGSSFRLYLKNGDYQMAREYRINGDRVHYYSTERDQWEDIPVALCDLKKTEAKRQRAAADVQQQTKLEDEEEQFERAQRRIVEEIPMNAGAYFLENGQVKTLDYAESTFVKSKRRQALKMITPIPLVAGKVTVQLKGEQAKFSVGETEPEFYLRLEQEQRFGIIKLESKNGVRIVEDIEIAPITNENFENPKQIATFQRQLAAGLYKIWPQKPLDPGQYALIEYTDGETDFRLWDFGCNTGTAAADRK